MRTRCGGVIDAATATTSSLVARGFTLEAAVELAAFAQALRSGLKGDDLRAEVRRLCLLEKEATPDGDAAGLRLVSGGEA